MAAKVFSDPKSLPFFAHFTELRKRLTQYIAVLVLLSFIFYIRPIYEFIMGILFNPIIPHLADYQTQLMFTGPFEAMTFRFSVGVYAALLVTSPLFVYHLFAFFAPAMKERERKWVFPVTFAAAGLFILGVLFAYFAVVPMAFEWLVSQNTDYTVIMPRAQEWLSGVGMLLLGFGISFELPLVMFFMIGLGVISYPVLRESWRVAYVAMFAVGAIVTPDKSPFTMVALAIALIVLYEGGLLAARFAFANRVDEQYVDLYEDMLMYDDEPTDDKEELAKRKKITKQAMAAKKRIEQREARRKQESDEGDAATEGASSNNAADVLGDASSDRTDI
ncbi:MAG: twin-arginine translocase subunit TatC [Coriobacteriia bacterium]|nr:twin-arginine translocase subunit TatC [Coriobacteriia bacterium]